MDAFKVIMASLALAITLTGCNTVAGMGTDITKSAEWTRDKMSGNNKGSN